MKKTFVNHFYFITVCLILGISILSAKAQLVPSDLMGNCKQWKITYPTGVEDKTLCGEANNEFFYVNETEDAIVFRTPIRSDNGTTPNSDNVRSELRERLEDGTLDIYWTTAGTHVVYVKQAITHLPIKKPQLVATQIHGNKDAGIDDAMVMRLEGTKLFLSFNGAKLRSNVSIKTDYVLGTIHEVIFKIIDGKHYCYYSEDGNLLTAYRNNTASSYLIKADGNDYVMDLSYDQSYFKVGNYTQSNPTEEGAFTDDPTNYGEVKVYKFFVEHSGNPVSGVTLSPKTTNLTLGSTLLLTPTLSPVDASNKTVGYSTSNANVAAVSLSGLVTAVSVGSATITVTTADGDFTDTSVINVIAAVTGSNLALNKPITGTGTPDGTNVPSNLVDGLTSTRWAVSGFPKSATIDLGAEYTVGRTELVCYSDRAYKYTISTASTVDGVYTDIVDRSSNTTPGTAANPIIDVFMGVKGRFVKINVTGVESYTGAWVSLTELRVFEAPTTPTAIATAKASEVNLWPNPATNIVNINGEKEFTTLTVFDQIGKLVKNQSVRNKTVDITDLKSGMYIFRLSNESETVNKLLIKK